MANKQERWISIMIVPEDGTGLRKWRLTNRKFSYLKAALVASGVFLLIGLTSMVSLVIMYGKVKDYKRSNEQLLEATSKLDTIASRLNRYAEKERKLREILDSDFQLPVSMKTEDVTSDSRLALSSGEKTGDEFGQLLKRQEDRLRMVPSIWPVNAWKVSKNFKNTGNPRLDHYGIDILAPKGSGVHATADGKVIFAGSSRVLGLHVIIDHGENNWVTKYGHNKSLLVAEGDNVIKGQTIAVYGDSEDASGTGAHLHYAMFYKGKPENPLNSLPEKSGMKIALQLNSK